MSGISDAHVANMSGKLSIIIVSYKSREEIGPCLASIPRMVADHPVEVILVDNFPADNVGIMLRDNFPWVNYLDPQSNLGFGRANNLGFAESSGEYVLFLNPDTVVNEKALTHSLERLATDADIGLLSPKLVQADGAMDQACRRSIPTLWDGFCRATGLAVIFPRTALFAGYNLTHLPVDGTYEVGAINGAFMLASRSALVAIAPDGKVFDEAFFMYGDDLDLCIRMKLGGYKIVYDGGVQIIHLKGQSVAKEWEAMSQAIFDANRDVYIKHFGNSRISRIKYVLAFGAWKALATVRAKLQGYRRVKPL
jgi:N-acetylglucosaminyl-diphospho-decaprenol L-rhamnosyltransferase